MDGSKPFWASTTFWGVFVSAVGKLIAGVFGIDWADGDVNTWTTILAGGASLVGDIVAWVGRKNATKKIS